MTARDKYEISAIYDDAGTPPREEVRRMKRHNQLRRIEYFLVAFRLRAPWLFLLFAVGIGMFFAGMVLSLLELARGTK